MKTKTMKRFHFLLAAALIATGCFAQQSERISSKGFAVFSPHSAFQPYEFTRHAVGDNDVLIEIMYSGICHSDIHTAHNDWYSINIIKNNRLSIWVPSSMSTSTTPMS